ncbi:MAG: hypothetical protein K5853_06505 [Lachnospiraceae bacterium]|nr:hypothetical protein [Lachnospiraceae bacterium]
MSEKKLWKKALAFVMTLAMVFGLVAVLPKEVKATTSPTVTVTNVQYSVNESGEHTAAITFTYSGGTIPSGTPVDTVIGLSDGSSNLDYNTYQIDGGHGTGLSLVQNPDGSYTLTASPVQWTISGSAPNAGAAICVGVEVGGVESNRLDINVPENGGETSAGSSTPDSGSTTTSDSSSETTTPSTASSGGGSGLSYEAIQALTAAATGQTTQQTATPAATGTTMESVKTASGKKADGAYEVTNSEKKQVTWTAGEAGEKKTEKVVVGNKVTKDGVTYTVTKLEDGALGQVEGLEKVTLNVTKITAGAMEGCKTLEKIVLGKDVQKVGVAAFGDEVGAKVSSLTVSGKLDPKNIDMAAFTGVGTEAEKLSVAIETDDTEKYEALKAKIEDQINDGLDRKTLDEVNALANEMVKQGIVTPDSITGKAPIFSELNQSIKDEQKWREAVDKYAASKGVESPSGFRDLQEKLLEKEKSKVTYKQVKSSK